MAISPTTLISLLLLLLTTTVVSAAADDLADHLQSLRAAAPGGVIHLNDALLRRITTTTSTRPFSVVIFFDATQLHDKSELHLKPLKSEFRIVSQSFLTNNPSNNDLFFAEIEFGESQSSFAAFGVNSLPHIKVLPGNAKDLKADSVALDSGDFSRLSDVLPDFVHTHTRISIGPIHRPPFLSKMQIGFIVTAFIIWVPFFVRKLLRGETLFNDKRVWLAGAVFVYFFSVSGAMHNIIRKMPMFIMDRNDPGKLVFFYQGSGMQLGAEGFAVGFLYTVVGLLLAFVTHVLVKVRNVNVQRVVMICALIVSFWAVRKVVVLDHWKTGYGIHAYLPSSWK